MKHGSHRGEVWRIRTTCGFIPSSPSHSFFSYLVKNPVKHGIPSTFMPFLHYFVLYPSLPFSLITYLSVYAYLEFGVYYHRTRVDWPTAGSIFYKTNIAALPWRWWLDPYQPTNERKSTIKSISVSGHHFSMVILKPYRFMSKMFTGNCQTQCIICSFIVETTFGKVIYNRKNVTTSKTCES